MIKRSLFIFVLLVALAAKAQQPMVFHHVSTNEGLSNSNVKTILKDKLGFLWIGTENGLNRYDGYSFKIYSAEKGTSQNLLNNDISNLQEDKNGNIWITTEAGYMVYEREKDAFTEARKKLSARYGISINGNYRVHIDKDGNLWAIDDQNAFYYNITDKTLNTFHHNLKKDNLRITHITDDGTHLIALFSNGKLWQIDKKNGQQAFYDLPENMAKEINPKSSKVYLDSYHSLWIFSGTSDHLYYQAKPFSDWEIIPLPSKIQTATNVINNILDDENGKVWISTDHKGVFIFDREKKYCTNYLHDAQLNTTIGSNYVSCLYQDNSGVIWMGHNKKGISFYHNSFLSFKNITHPDCRDVTVILQDHTGAIWMGTDGDGVFRKENINYGSLEKVPLPNTAVVTLLQDHKNRIWIGTYLNGLYCYQNGKVTNYTKANSPLVSDNVWKLTEDTFGNIWIGTLGGGVQYVSSETLEFTTLDDKINDLSFTLDMAYTGSKELYVGTDDGLFVIDVTTKKIKKQTKNRKGDARIREELISSITVDTKNRLWLGHHDGLTVWDIDRDAVYYMNKKNGLCDNIIHGFAEDAYGKMWITTSNGLSIVSVSGGQTGELEFAINNFNTGDGLKDNFFNNNAICKLNSKEIVMGGTEGYTVAYPNLIDALETVPSPVTFTGLSIGNQPIMVNTSYKGKKILDKPIEFTDSLTLHYNDKVIALDFFTGDLLNTHKITYWYQIKGFSDQWMSTTNNRIVFSSLAPGSYILTIKACAGDGNCTTQNKTLYIMVPPPFYASGWAILLYFMAVICIILLIVYRARKHHRRRLAEQRIRLEREQEKQLNEMKLRFFTNVSHDLRTPLTLIITPLQKILEGSLEEKMRKKLQTVYKNSEHLLHLINSLLDFRKLDINAEKLTLQLGDIVSFIKDICDPFDVYASERNISFSVSSELKQLFMHFDAEKVHKIVSNILSNAFKYTPDGGDVELHIYEYQGLACISIADTGYGISDADKEHIFERFYQSSHKPGYIGEGIGLHIVHEYVHLHNGTIQVKDNEPKGSIFLLQLPLKEQPEIQEDTLLEAEPLATENTMPIKTTVLIVDDNTDFCEFLADSLTEYYTVVTANNGQQALQQLRKYPIDIVVSDVMMPIMSGTELCKEIKTNINWSHIPVILLTARTNEEYKIESLELGADDYLTKPFNLNLLKLRIDKFLEWTHTSHLTFSQKADISPGEITITSLDEQLIEKALNIVEENIANIEFSVEELSEHLGLSRGHLYKKLMSVTGKSPSEFIRTVRLKRGRQLLEKSQLQIAEIAYMVGFNSPKRFTANFKSEFGVSPSEYLRSTKEEHTDEE